jgi:hypothetical protein
MRWSFCHLMTSTEKAKTENRQEQSNAIRREGSHFLNHNTSLSQSLSLPKSYISPVTHVLPSDFFSVMKNRSVFHISQNHSWNFERYHQIQGKKAPFNRSSRPSGNPRMRSKFARSEIQKHGHFFQCWREIKTFRDICVFEKVSLKRR